MEVDTNTSFNCLQRTMIPAFSQMRMAFADIGLPVEGPPIRTPVPCCPWSLAAYLSSKAGPHLLPALMLQEGPHSGPSSLPMVMQVFQGTLTSYFLLSLRWPQGTQLLTHTVPGPVWRELCVVPCYTNAFQGKCWHFTHPVSPGTTSNFLNTFSP